MSEKLENTTLHELTLSPAASPVRTLVSQGWAQGLKANDQDCGLRCSESFASYDRDTCSWKTSQLCLVGESGEFSQTFPASGSMQSGKLYEHRTLAHRTAGSASLSLPTPTKAMGKRGWGLSRTGR